MTYSKCGLLLILAAAGLAACGGDPTDAFRDEGVRVIANPASVFLPEGTQKFVTVQLVDEAGDQLETDFEPTDVSSGITVVRDSSFLGTTNGTNLKTSERFIVTGVTPSSGSFTVGTGSAALVIPVKVTPLSLAATYSSLTPAMNEPVTMTVSGYHFTPGAATVFLGDTAIILGLSEDGTALTFLPLPGSVGPATVGGVTIDFLPETPLELPTVDEFTVGPLVAIPGTDAPATAPAIAAPEPGAVSALFDAMPLGAAVCGGNSGIPCQLYSLSLPADAVLHARLDVSNLTDLGLYVMSADGLTDTGEACDALGNADDPSNLGFEECDLTLPAGDYLLGVISFGIFYGPDPEPAWIGLSLTPAVPAP